jgi:hypothetical protein
MNTNKPAPTPDDILLSFITIKELRQYYKYNSGRYYYTIPIQLWERHTGMNAEETETYKNSLELKAFGQIWVHNDKNYVYISEVGYDSEEDSENEKNWSD